MVSGSEESETDIELLKFQKKKYSIRLFQYETPFYNRICIFKRILTTTNGSVKRHLKLEFSNVIFAFFIMFF